MFSSCERFEYLDEDRETRLVKEDCALRAATYDYCESGHGHFWIGFPYEVIGRANDSKHGGIIRYRISEIENYLAKNRKL